MVDQLEQKAREAIERCDAIADFDERLVCKVDLLHAITEVQDYVNLNVRGDFMSTDPTCSKDKRWVPVHMVDDANAIILGITKARYDPSVFWRRGSYVREKMNALGGKQFSLPSNPHSNPSNPENIHIKTWKGYKEKYESGKWKGGLDAFYDRLARYRASIAIGRDFGEDLDSYLTRKGLKEFYAYEF